MVILQVSLEMFNIGASLRLNANLKSPYLPVCSRLSVCLESPAKKRRSVVFLRTITAVCGLLALSLVFTVLETRIDFSCLYPPLNSLKTTYCFLIFPDFRIKMFKDFSRTSNWLKSTRLVKPNDYIRLKKKLNLERHVLDIRLHSYVLISF